MTTPNHIIYSHFPYFHHITALLLFPFPPGQPNNDESGGNCPNFFFSPLSLSPRDDQSLYTSRRSLPPPYMTTIVYKLQLRHFLPTTDPFPRPPPPPLPSPNDYTTLLTTSLHHYTISTQSPQPLLSIHNTHTHPSIHPSTHLSSHLCLHLGREIDAQEISFESFLLYPSKNMKWNVLILKHG